MGQRQLDLTYLMEQIESEIDCLSAIRDDLSTLPFVRHYMQEQLSSMPKKEQSCELPFNHLINLVVSQLSITNRQIAANSKLNTGLLDNGKEIASKKGDIFRAFIKEYPEIQQALQMMHPSLKPVFQHSVMALSNLILKLSINMAKISIVVVTKLLTPPCLDIFTTSLLFEKYIQSFSTSNKKHNTPEQARQHLKQFPKVAYIKISKKRNPYDLKFIKQQQRQFNKPMQTIASYINACQPSIYNVHFLEFYEQDPLKTLDKQLSLPFYQGFNLSQQFGIKQPFGFQLFLLIKQIAVNRLQEFRPDIIVYVEDFDSSKVGIQPQVKGLILNQLSQKVQAKIYVFKEFGITQEIKKSWLNSQGMEQAPFSQEYMLAYETEGSSITSLPGYEMPRSKINSSIISQKDIHLHLERYMKQNQIICVELFQMLQKQIKAYYISQSILKPGEKQKQNMPQLLKKIKCEYSKILQQQLLYMSLALIQKTNFQQTFNQYSNYIFPEQFLQKTIHFLQYVHALQPNNFSEYKQFLKNKVQKISCMLSVSKQSKQINQDQLPFYNILTGKKQKFSVWGGKQYEMTFSKNDTFCVAYAKEHIILCIFREEQYAIYMKHMNNKYFEYVKRQKKSDKPQLFNKFSTFVYNNQYIYKAFGEPIDHSPQLNSAIYRFKISNLDNLDKNSWQLVETQCISLLFLQKDKNIKGIRIPLQHKIHGFGYSYYLNEKDQKDNFTIFGGGYNYKLENQQKVNKYLYIIKDNQKKIYKVGKTNGQIINQQENMRNKMVIYPFIYGIPIAVRQNQLIILNTNGYQENVNHSKKLFLTKIKLKSIDNAPAPLAVNGIGIVSQNKLHYGNQAEVEIANKNTIMKYALGSYNRINRHKNCVVVYNHRNQAMVIETSENLIDKLDVIKVSPLEEMNQYEDTLTISFSNKKMILKVPL